MAEVSNVAKDVAYNDSISKIEYHNYLPFLRSSGKSNEIRISSQQGCIINV